jgi:hypothetical protein
MTDEITPTGFDSLLKTVGMDDLPAMISLEKCSNRCMVVCAYRFNEANLAGKATAASPDNDANTEAIVPSGRGLLVGPASSRAANSADVVEYSVRDERSLVVD